MNFPARALGRLVETLDRGGVIVAPCPVGYVVATSEASGVERIFELKGRDQSRPLSVGGSALHEGRAHLVELAALDDLPLRRITTTMGLVGSRHVDAPRTPLGVGTEFSVAVFVGLGGILEAVAGALRKTDRMLYLSSANRSGSGNTACARDLPDCMRSDAVTALLDDSLVSAARRLGTHALASPMVRLGNPCVWLREGGAPERAAEELAKLGFELPAMAHGRRG